jgi:hypothetical protein
MVELTAQSLVRAPGERLAAEAFAECAMALRDL